MDMYHMKLNERVELADNIEVIRVPGGWIYILRQYHAGCADQAVFVPFNNEFQEKRNSSW